MPGMKSDRRECLTSRRFLGVILTERCVDTLFLLIIRRIQ